MTSTGGEELSAFIAESLGTERSRRDAINQRGQGLITNSSALAALLFAASALVTGSSGYVPPAAAIWGLMATSMAFVVAAVFGLLAMRTVAADVVAPEQLAAWRARDDVWLNDASQVSRLLAKANVRSLTSLRAGNNEKMTWARRGFYAQIVALAALTFVVVVILFGAL